ncbi:concanavalin A-like lectin/glucanase domain-containing protein [Xylogone sp. PMI_703]|nr:concanavalin A-like lectin/glucanase domain-containing protein [Xylogone sp. PMI_703]
MVRSSIIAAALVSASVVYGQATCGLDKKCPKATPCCSQYGQCGVGAYCLGGCDPRSSFSLDSCVPEPVCQSKTYKFDSMDGITSKTEYLGDATKTDWVMDGQAVNYNGNVLLTMAPDTVGTVLASSTYMWYGNVSAKFKTSRDAGVVTAFILLSDVHDEIDYEFVGTELTTAQTNYYFQGIPDYTNSGNISLSDTFDNFHTYEIQWTPDSITWLVDGQVGRVKQRSETYNATAKQWNFPQTPARVQLSLWPGGLSTNAQGTIDWAGGPINWNSQDIKNNGYYYATFAEVTISCYNAQSPPGTNSGTSYTYNSPLGLNNTVVDGDKPTVLKSLLGTGTNMSADYPHAPSSSSGSKTNPSASASPSASDLATIPGLSGAGPGTDGHPADSGDDSSGSSSASSPAPSGGASGGDSGSSSGSGDDGFSQGSGSGGSGSSGSSQGNNAARIGSQEGVLKGSIFAGIIAVVAMMAL